MTSSRRVRPASAGAAAGLLLVLAVAFWPSTSYLVTRGTSMKPAFSSGALAVVRRSGTYRLGDVVAYRSPTLHRLVLHRIVASDGGTFSFKGDANSFVDPERLPGSAIAGRLSFQLPYVGAALLWLLHPFNALLLSLLIALVLWDRSRIAALVTGTAAARTVPVAAVDLQSDRVVRIRDMSFPHELAIADVVAPTSLMSLANRYDRPVLYDDAEETLFVVESSMLFRCVLPEAAPAAGVPLALVRDLPPPTTAPGPLSSDERRRRHSWPLRRPHDGRRRPSPQGRDWNYAAADRTGK